MEILFAAGLLSLVLVVIAGLMRLELADITKTEKLQQTMKRLAEEEAYKYILENESKIKRGAALYGLDNSNEIDLIKLAHMLEKIEEHLVDQGGKNALFDFYEKHFEKETKDFISEQRRKSKSAGFKCGSLAKRLVERIKRSELIYSLVTNVKEFSAKTIRMGDVGDEDGYNNVFSA